jgi:hypothetical protein
VIDLSRILAFDEVKAQLEKYWEEFALLPEEGLAWFKKQIASGPSGLVQPSPLLRAVAVRDYVVDKLRVRHSETMLYVGQRWVLVDRGLVVQFKMIDEKGRTKNYPTRTAVDYDRQLEMPGFPPGMRVTAGYRLDELATEVVEVSMVARVGKSVVWREAITVNQGELFNAQAPKESTSQRKKTRKFQPKKDVAEQRGVANQEEKERDKINEAQSRHTKD